MLAACVFGVPVAVAQSPYGVGGYLERPYVPDDDEATGPTSQDSNAAEAARRQRRARAVGSGDQARPQPGAGPQGAAGSQTTGAAQGGPQKKTAETSQGNTPNGFPDGYPAAGLQKKPGSGETAQQRNRANGGEPKSTRDQQAGSGNNSGKHEASSDTSLPPMPQRRPQFADAPARTAVAAAPVPEVTPGQAAVTSSADPETPPAADTPTAPDTPKAEVAMASPATAAPAQQAPEQAATWAPAAGVQSAEAPDQSTPPVSQPQAAATVESAAVPADASQASTMMAATEAAPASPETLSPEADAKPEAIAADSAPKPAESPPAAMPSPAEDLAAAMPADAPQPQAVVASAEERDAPSQEAAAPSVAQDVAAPTQPQAESVAVKAPQTTAAAAQETQAPASPATPPAAQTAIPGVEPAMPTLIPALPTRQTRLANLSESTPTVPQPPLRQTASLDKIIGQMLVVGFRGLTPDEAWPQKLAGQIKAGSIGGVLFMSHNVQSPQQIKTLTGFLQKAKSDIPALFAVDQEGGIVQRLSAEKGFQEYPTAGKMGQSNDPLTAYSVYKRLAAELSQNGFNLNLGPVVDLLRNTASPIIAGKERSFGAQPKHVAAFAKAFCMAHHDEGILTVLKHFPGHGSTPFDTHLQPVDVGQTWKDDEIAPYRELIAAHTAQAVMMGHIANPVMSDEPGMPASLSAKAIRQVLRGDLGFTGVVISDDLEMGAIHARYSIEDSVVKAIKAGNDIVILSNQATPTPDLPERVAAAIRKAVDTGELRREELQASYDRILSFKRNLPVAVASTNGTTNGGSNGAAAAGNKRASAERGGKAASAR